MRELPNGGMSLGIDAKLIIRLWLFHKLKANRNLMEIMNAARMGSTKPVSDELLSYKISRRAAVHEWIIECLRNLGASEEEISTCA